MDKWPLSVSPEYIRGSQQYVVTHQQTYQRVPWHITDWQNVIMHHPDASHKAASKLGVQCLPQSVLGLCLQVTWRCVHGHNGWWHIILQRTLGVEEWIQTLIHSNMVQSTVLNKPGTLSDYDIGVSDGAITYWANDVFRPNHYMGKRVIIVNLPTPEFPWQLSMVWHG